MLVIHIATADLRVSAHAVGEKKASIAAEAGIHYLMQNFNILNLPGNEVTRDHAIHVTGGSDANSVFWIKPPTAPSFGPEFLPMTGMYIENGGLARKRFDIVVVGEHLNYHTKAEIQVGVGYGPVPSGSVPD